MTFPEFATTLDRVQPTINGWCVKEKAQMLASIIIATHPAVVVEIGVYAGSSAFPIALALKYVGTGLLIAIDPWNKQAGVEAQTTPVDREHWDSVNHEAVYQEFMALIKRHDLTDCVKVLRTKSDQVNPPNAINLAHIDGAHSDQAVRDVSRFATRVVVGGYVVLDDLDWSGGGVRRAEAFLLQQGFKRLYQVDKCALYQRVR